MGPGFLDTSWKALDNRAGLEGSGIRGVTAHHEGLLHPCLWDAIGSYLEANLWNFPQHFKRINRLFLLFNYFLVIFFLSVLFCFSLSPYSVIWAMWILTLMPRDLTSDFKLRLFQLLFFSTLHLLLPMHTHTHTQSADKKWKPLEVCQFSAKKNTNNKYSIWIRHSTSWSNAMAIFFFCVSDRLYTQEGKKLRFPFGRELTTCRRLFKWRGGLACATVNKLKCWEVQWVSGAPSKAAPTWHTAFDVLAKFVFSTTTTLTQSVVHKLTHPHKKTHRHTQKQYVIWTDACHVVILAQLVWVHSHNT